MVTHPHRRLQCKWPRTWYTVLISLPLDLVVSSCELILTLLAAHSFPLPSQVRLKCGSDGEWCCSGDTETQTHDHTHSDPLPSSLSVSFPLNSVAQVRIASFITFHTHTLTIPRPRSFHIHPARSTPRRAPGSSFASAGVPQSVIRGQRTSMNSLLQWYDLVFCM